RDDLVTGVQTCALPILDRALGTPPFNFVLHTSPLHERTGEFYHWHIEVMPKLTQVAGFEWGTGFYINPIPPEEAAAFLRDAEVRSEERRVGKEWSDGWS